MKRSRQSLIFFAILGITFLGVAFYAYVNWHRIVRPTPPGGWKYIEPFEYHFHSDFLNSVGFEEVSLESVPITDALTLFVDRVNNQNRSMRKWSLKLTDLKLITQNVTLELSNVQAFSVLQFITELTSSKFYITEDRVIEVVPVNHIHPKELELVECDFIFHSDDHALYMRKPGPHDVKSELTKRLHRRGFLSFSFGKDETALYYPKEYRVRLKVRSPKKNFDKFYSVMEAYNVQPEPILSEMVADLFFRIKDKLFLSSPTVPPVLSQTEPDPFGSGSVNLTNDPPSFEPIGDLIQTGKSQLSPTDSK